MQETGDVIAETITPAMSKSTSCRKTGISVNMYHAIRQSIATGKETTSMTVTTAISITDMKTINKERIMLRDTFHANRQERLSDAGVTGQKLCTRMDKAAR
jgi:protein involved in sex pheromone biosynthesis